MDLHLQYQADQRRREVNPASPVHYYGDAIKEKMEKDKQEHYERLSKK